MAQCSTIAFDVGDEAACRAAIAAVVQRHGRLDILVNNAGINRRQPKLTRTSRGLRTVRPGASVLFVLATRTSLGRAYCGTTGGSRSTQ